MPQYRKLRPLTSKEYELILRLIRQGFIYREIVAQAQSQLGSSIKTCHIAQVKRESGIGTRGAWNTGKSYILRSHQPDHKNRFRFSTGHKASPS